MEKYTLRDLAAGRLILQNDTDIQLIEDVESVDVKMRNGKKHVVIHVGFFDMLFNSELKSAISSRIKADLRSENITTYEFAI